MGQENSADLVEEMKKYADTLRVSVSDDGVLWLTKVNADAGYGISMRMLEALRKVLTKVKSEESVRAIVIDAEGEAMQNGAVMVGEIKPDVADLTRDDFAEIVTTGHTIGRLISEMPIPVIGVAKGGILGGGLELFLRTDFAFCTDAAEFCLPEVTVGFVAAWGGTQHAGRYMPFRKAQEMLLTGLPINGRQAEDYGLVTRSFPDSAALDQHLSDLLAHLRQCSPSSFRWTKQCLAAVWEGDLPQGEKVELEAQVETMASGDFIKALGAFMRGHFFDFLTDARGKKR